MEFNENVIPNLINPRKRKSNPNQSVKHIKKLKLHSSANKTPQISCSHARSDKNCKAHSLSENEVKQVFDLFYTDSDTTRQDNFILKYVSSKPPTRHRPRKENFKNREFTFDYEVPKGAGELDVCVKVCSQSFRSILSIGQTRIINVMKTWAVKQRLRKENRGGRRENGRIDQLKQMIRHHIQKYQCRASHYGRCKTPHRKYLPSSLSVMRMWTTFKQENDESCSYSLYYSIFVREFNLGFGSPATDICSECVRINTQMKMESDPEKKKEYLGNLLLHKSRARKFYTLLNDCDYSNPSEITIVFDLMQNQELPKTPIGEAFYSRQLHQYFLGIVIHKGKESEQSKREVFFYSWGEYESGKGSNLIASALFDFLCKHVPSHVKLVRLFSDSCVGQNKNYTMVAMLSSVAKERGVKFVYYFPIRGHSYLPADRAFGRVEKILRGLETILIPAEYFVVFASVGAVKEIFKDFEIFDWKRYQASKMKVRQNFLISESRVLEITGDLVRQKTNFFEEYETFKVLRRGVKWLPRDVQSLTKESHVSNEKKADVLKLLKSLGIGNLHPAKSFYDAALV